MSALRLLDLDRWGRNRVVRRGARNHWVEFRDFYRRGEVASFGGVRRVVERFGGDGQNHKAQHERQNGNGEPTRAFARLGRLVM